MEFITSIMEYKPIKIFANFAKRAVLNKFKVLKLLPLSSMSTILLPSNNSTGSPLTIINEISTNFSENENTLIYVILITLVITITSILLYKWYECSYDILENMSKEEKKEKLEYWTTVKEAALLSKEIYSDPEEIKKSYPGVIYQNIDETACLIWHRQDKASEKVYVVFRGTEITEINNIKTILNIRKEPVDYQDGEIHEGFKKANDLIWPWLSDQLKKYDENTQIIFTGHSLGGALAIIAAARLKCPNVDVFTFGCPRISNETFKSNLQCNDKVHRFINNRDIVTKLPFIIMGYVHSGNETIFDEYGNVVTWNRFLYFLRLMYDLITEFLNTACQNLDDHYMSNYIDVIQKQEIKFTDNDEDS